MIRFASVWAVALGTSLLLAAAAEAGTPREFELYRPSGASFYFDYGDADAVVDRVFPLGDPGDVGLLSDVDGDTVADAILFRSGLWFVDLGNDGTVDIYVGLGAAGDVPLVGDFAGSGRGGFAVYRPSTGFWYVDTDANGTVDRVSPFGGIPGDRPVVADYDGDGIADRAIYRSGTWYVDFGFDGTLDRIYYLGGLPQDVPLAADFDGDWKADQAVFRDGLWYIDYGNDSTVDRVVAFGMAGDQPLLKGVNPAGIYVRAEATGGDGTPARPFGMIADAVAAVPEPTPATIRIAAGTYFQSVALANRHDLTLLGAGVSATHLSPFGVSPPIDVMESQGVVVRNLHVGGPRTDGRGVIVAGSVLTLDRVSTANIGFYGVQAFASAAAPTTLLIENSNLDGSREGNGLTASGVGVDVVVRRTTMDRNGTELYGSGANVSEGATLTVEASSASGNSGNGITFFSAQQTDRLVVHHTRIAGNGDSGVTILDNAASSHYPTPAELYANRIEDNPIGVFVADGGFYHPRSFHDNQFFRNGTGLRLVGAIALIEHNWFYDNGFAVSALSAGPSMSGNLIEVPLSRTSADGVVLSGRASASIGYPPPLQPNTFRNITGDGAGIRCVIPTSGGLFLRCMNVFDNVTNPVVDCESTCQ